MKAVVVSSLALAAPAASALTSPSFAQTQSDQQNQPGTGGTSKPGVKGLPGGNSGPTVKPTAAKPPPQRAAMPPETDGQSGYGAMPQDESKVPGFAGRQIRSRVDKKAIGIKDYPRRRSGLAAVTINDGSGPEYHAPTLIDALAIFLPGQLPLPRLRRRGIFYDRRISR